MNVEFERRFLKELAKLPAPIQKRVEEFVFKKLPKASSLQELGKVEKLRGYEGFHKVRFGDYRLGLKNEGDTIIVKRILHRKEIYKFFP